MKKIAVFDLDGTLLKGDSVTLYLDFLEDNKYITHDYRKNEEEHGQNFLNGTLDIGYFYEFILAPLAGKTVEEVNQLFESYLKDYIKPEIYKEAFLLIQSLKEQGYKIVIASATIDIIVNSIAFKLLNADYVIASKIEVKDNKITGKILKPYSHQEGKAILLKKMAQENDWDLNTSYGWGDTVNDIHLLETVAHPQVVNPKGRMFKEAQLRGWPVNKFY